MLMLIKFHDFSMTNKFSENSRFRDQIPWLSMTFQVACEPWGVSYAELDVQIFKKKRDFPLLKFRMFESKIK